MSIVLKDVTKFYSSTKGQVILLASETPESLEITGADVEGVPDDYVFIAGSEMISPTTGYMAFEDGVFTPVYSTESQTAEDEEEPGGEG